MTYIELHRHSVYSLLDGCSTNAQFAQRASEMGMWALPLTDHGNVNGALDHMKACEKFGIQPLVGIEAYYRPRGDVHGQAEWRYRKWHLILIAQNLTGWHNLLKISSAAYRPENLYQFPCVTDDLLAQYNEGLICTTACVLGPLAYLIENHSDKDVDDWLAKMSGWFKGRFYVELQPHGFDRQVALNRELAYRAGKHGLPLSVGGDAHYAFKGWVETQKISILVGINKTVKEWEEKARAREVEGLDTYDLWHDGMHLLSEEEVVQGFAQHHPDLSPGLVREAINNNELIAQSCVPFLIDRSLKMPRGAPTMDEAERVVRQWAWDGLERLGKSDDPVYRERLEYELSVIEQKRHWDYLMITAETTRWARSSDPLPPVDFDPDPQPKRPMRIGSCRGSAGASLVCYCLRITGINPINYKLKFERFLNPGRKGIPDIDLDFPDDRRDEVKEYVARRFGRDCVADVVAMSRFTPRAAVQNVARIMGVDYLETKKVTDQIDYVHDEDLEAMRTQIRDLDRWAERHPEAWKHAVRLENGKGNVNDKGETSADPFVKGLSKHAGGVIITPGPVNEYMATVRAESDQFARTAWSETPRLSICDDFGFVKWDFLSITGITQQDRIVSLIAEHTGEQIDLDELPVSDDPYATEPEVMDHFCAGHTLGTNQFEGQGITRFLKDAQPRNLVDLAACNALYRPGAMGAGGHNRYLKRRKDQESYTIPEPLKDTLSDTMGIHCFQEQIMEIFEVLVGYTAAQADDVRKEIDKLNRGKSDQGRVRLAARKDEFIEKASVLIGKEPAEKLWEEILPYTGYCLTGDTVVIRGAAGPHAKQETTLAELYKAWYSKTSVGKKLRARGVKILAMDGDGRVRPALVKSIWSNGRKLVYEIKTDGGRSIKATVNHRFLTPSGYELVQTLRVGDELVVMGQREEREKVGASTERARGKTYVGRVGGIGVPEGSDNPAYVDGRTALFQEAKRQVSQRSRGKCEQCGFEPVPDSGNHALEFAHLISLDDCDGDFRRYHSQHNIRHLCNSCHKSLDYRKGERHVRWHKGLPTVVEHVASIELIGEDEVFDVQMDSDEHNFIANGIVSHNSFNRPHASGYCLQAYQDQWLRTHYPLESFAVILTLAPEKVPRAIREAQHFGVGIEKPDINRSGDWFSVDYDASVIRFGLTAIDGVGDVAVKQILEHQPYESLVEFDMRHSVKGTKVNRGHRQALIEAGALDSLGARDDWTQAQKSSTEMKRLKIALHPGGTFGDDEEMVVDAIHSQDEVSAMTEKTRVVCAGRITDISKRKIKSGPNKGRDMANVRIRIGIDFFDCTFFYAEYAEYGELIEKDRGIIVEGYKDSKDSVIVKSVMDIGEWVKDRRGSSHASR